MVEVAVTRRPEGYVLVRVDGELDLATRLPVVEALDRAVGDGVLPVVMDLGGVRFFSLAGADRVGDALAALGARGHQVRVVCADPGPVWRLVRLLGLDGRWVVHHQVHHAVADLDLSRR
jgi:anti-anti-sigma factor